ncbi:importin alpha re-exporter [[Candida] jaroonii]|uniref:Importin alpha re-exporter n=1 Tax=[Candida] jaroonii TaxID=467808 RepID=A0ACA9Y5S2_9ASCO|nr:importin alpha re-exporter [[Candida] jaroonii]
MVDNNIETIAKILEQSLLPQYAKQSEQELKSIENVPEFSINLMKIISSNLPDSIRLAGVLFLKNLIKRKWVNENGEYLLPMEDVGYIKLEILNIMISLPNFLQVQVGECISIIAESDFPHNWTNLIDDLIGKFSESDFNTNKSILLVSHSIFKKWRPLFRSDELFLEIKMVLDKFAQPFMMLLTKIDELIDNCQDIKQLNVYLENLLLLIQIYYDLNCQDIPEFFEDNMMAGMKIMHKYLNYENPSITDASNDEEVDTLIKIKTSIIELINLYLTRYTEIFEPLIENFITTIWELITSFITKQIKFDLLIVKCLQFLTSIIKISNYSKFFNNENSLKEILNKIILPNIIVRDSDLEMFEDEPINYVRFDLEGSEYDSRRKSATDFLRELKEVNNELLTKTVMEYVDKFLSESDNWQNKDLAIYLFSSLASKGSITNIGVTSTNMLVDVVKFFSENIANDLMVESTHPILIMDSIKYILNFRNQLTKDQLLSVFKILVNHLTNANPVIYTYSSITIEKLLTMTNFNENHELIFNKYDLQPYLNDLLTNTFKLLPIDSSYPPEKLSENEFLIKLVMRILDTSKDLISKDFKMIILNQLLSILKIIYKNPSNPKFNHFIFESLGLIIKYSPNEINELIDLMVPNLLVILNEDVQEFVPYSFQILAYLLENSKGNELPSQYKSFIKPLMSPNLWQYKGNIPGITRLLIAIIEYDYKVFSQEFLTPLLGIFQKLIASKVNETYGFDLLESILLNFDLSILQDSLKTIAILILTRLKNSRTDKFLKRFIIFVFSICSIPSSTTIQKSLNGDLIINLLNLPQPGVFDGLLTNLILPNLLNFANLKDKKIILVGLSELLTTSISDNLKILVIEQIVKNIKNYQLVTKTNVTTDVVNLPLNELDLDMGSFGSNYSKLVTIQSEVFDPLSSIPNNGFDQIKNSVVNNIKKVNVEVLSQLPQDVQNALQEMI